MQAPLAAGAAFDAFLRDTAPADRQRRAWTPADGPMPALYLSHGAPPLFDDAVWIEQLFGWAQALPKPGAILIVSAHWESAPLSLSASAPRHPTGGRLQRLRPPLLPDDLPDPGRQEGVLVVGKAPALQYAHPTVEHYTPLFVTLGAATDPEQSVQPTIDGYIWGLSKRSFQAA